jgi:uncharacterized protein (TIGR00251 family)
VILDIRVIPRARRSEFGGERDGRQLVRLAAPPVDGAANAALIAFLAEHFKVPSSRIRIVSGERSRNKRVEIV